VGIARRRTAGVAVNVIHNGAASSRRRLLLGLGAVAVIGASVTTCALDRQRWTRHLGSTWGLAAGNGVVFAARRDDRGSVAAIDVHTGEDRWTYALRSGSSPSTLDDLVVVADRYGVHALDAATGTRRWMVEEAWSVAAGDGIVLCGQKSSINEYSLTAVEAASGEALWTVPFGASPGSPSAIAAGRVHIGMREVLRTLDAVTGATLWQQPLRDSAESVGVTVAGTVVCCGEKVSRFDVSSVKDRLKYGSVSQVGFDAASGRQLWRRPDEGERATAHAGTHFISAQSPRVMAWDAATGWERWTVYPLNDAPATIGPAPIVAGDTCYLAFYRLSTQRRSRSDALDMQVVVVALAADTGESRWSAEVDLGAYHKTSKQDPYLPFTVVGDTVVVGNDQGTVVGIA
jgi:outer membrane protein assembly factor BamB